MTPLEIELLLHCHVCPAPHPRIHLPLIRATLESFVGEGLVSPAINIGMGVTGVYRTTPRGDAHVKQLCNLPLPTQAWVDEHGKIIE